MDHYEFPHITDIGQVLKAIEGRPEFIVAKRDRHTIINYRMQGNDTFPRVLEPPAWNKLGGVDVLKDWPTKIVPDWRAAILRECRGIVFGEDGQVIARRLHKFFNLGEKEETFVDSVDFTCPHVIMDKLDGSMITPIPIGDHVRWGTKMGITDVAMQVEVFVAENSRYVKLAETYVRLRQTPIFEWCSRKQRIVVDYPKDQLVLVAVRENVTGEYVDYETLWEIGREFGVPVCGVSPDSSVKDGAKFAKYVRGLGSGLEGVVIRFNDGHMLKIKTDDYVRIHRAKESLLHENRVIEMIITEKTDDVLPHLLDHDRTALLEFQTEFWRGFSSTLNVIWTCYASLFERLEGNKKTFALMSAEAKMCREHKAAIFSIWGKSSKEDLQKYLSTYVGKHMGSQSKVDEARWVWGGAEWKSFFGAEDEVS